LDVVKVEVDEGIFPNFLLDFQKGEVSKWEVRIRGQEGRLIMEEPPWDDVPFRA
jgi:hypothetical protein